MKHTSFSILCLTTSALAEVNFGNWRPPVQGDLRCGCPAMNSMANHGFINRDGRNLTIAAVVPLLVEVFHLSTELATIVTQLGLSTAPNPSAGTFTLGDLNAHNLFEHDASLSRKDFFFGGDGFTFDSATFGQWFSHFDGEEFIDLASAAAARYSRIKDSRDRNPTFFYDNLKRITSYGETVKFLRTMVDPRNHKCRRDFVEIFFRQQRLPYKEGWRRPATEISGFSLAGDVLELALLTPEKMGLNDITMDVSRFNSPAPGPDLPPKLSKPPTSGEPGGAPGLGVPGGLKHPKALGL
ncbi:uncharacterized protein PgNI_02166 [Pyricularia grisea]|uniref:Heme haloperoxidase family profile domain-containing protein n=1 Tax=Pyricularia grisea TaxID=148305 RepID=A0A6P8BLZ0_PYRGI|nr:uncharacterized protein PgNI_02166 [Pyricularia grisea]TLD17655.1 hypothetical protein PgNI_02166 [Pyricularia grisea]